MMASKMTSTEDEIRQCFQVFDKNQDSFIEAAELKQGLFSSLLPIIVLPFI